MRSNHPPSSTLPAFQSSKLWEMRIHHFSAEDSFLHSNHMNLVKPIWHWTSTHDDFHFWDKKGDSLKICDIFIRTINLWEIEVPMPSVLILLLNDVLPCTNWCPSVPNDMKRSLGTRLLPSAHDDPRLGAESTLITTCISLLTLRLAALVQGRVDDSTIVNFVLFLSVLIITSEPPKVLF